LRRRTKGVFGMKHKIFFVKRDFIFQNQTGNKKLHEESLDLKFNLIRI
jgi:hypothetical protein